jgi:hypothetical protein
MEMKPFKSRLFRRTIKPDTLFYWDYLHAEILYRMKQLEILNCPCPVCDRDKITYKMHLSRLERDNKITEYRRPICFSGKGDCERYVEDKDPPPAAA